MIVSPRLGAVRVRASMSFDSFVGQSVSNAVFQHRSECGLTVALHMEDFLPFVTNCEPPQQPQQLSSDRLTD